jgi:uncharacterized membrane protein
LLRFHLISFLILGLLVVALAATPALAQTQSPVVRAVMFWINGCEHCEDVIQNVLPPLRDKYGAQFELLMIEVIDKQDIEMLYRVAASYNIPKELTGVPFLIIGDEVLVGSADVGEQLPALIADYLAHGGVDWPKNPVLADLLPTTSPTSSLNSNPAASKEPPISADNAPVKTRNNGFTLAIVVMVGMGITLLYRILTFIFGKSLPLPAWTDWLIPALIVIGFGVAGYLSYVETQSVPAICGPVGDCNTVQQSHYAKLFDVFPIGVLGLGGYVALLAAWLIRKLNSKIEKPAALSFFGMAFFAVSFSLYLTYLEPFVIRAVCIWCLTSAVLVTLLLLLGMPPALRQFTRSYEDE